MITPQRASESIEPRLVAAHYSITHIARLHMARGWRLVLKAHALFRWPMWVLFWIWAHLSTVGNLGARKRALWAFTRRFWRWYFSHRACSFYTSRDLPASPSGRLILATRIHLMSSIFIMQALDGPVLIPVMSAFIAQFRLVSWIPWSRFASPLKLISYDDLGTDAQYDNIKRLIDMGYTVVVYINPQNSHPKLDDVLTFESKVMTLVRDAPETWLLDHGTFGEYEVAYSQVPLFARIRILPLLELVDTLDEPDAVYVQVIARWLGYRSGRVVQRKG